MTTERDVERLLDRWLADGPTQVSDRAFAAIVERLAHERQLPAWRIDRRIPSMPMPMRTVAALAAVVVLAVVGFALLSPPAGNVAAPPTPAASPSSGADPSATATPGPSTTARLTIVCDDPAFTCAGPLDPGPHRTAAFQPAFSYVSPAGWENSLDRARAYTLQPPTESFALQVLSEVAIPEQTADCAPARKAGVGSSVDDWVTFMTTHPGLETSSVSDISVGDVTGKRFSFHRSPTWTATCPDSLGPAIVTVTDTGTPPTRMLFTDDQYTTWLVLDVRGTTVIIRVESGPSAEALAAAEEGARPILESIRFDPAS